MRMFAADLRATGELRADLSDEEIADVVWSMNGPEYWSLLVVDRGWSLGGSPLSSSTSGPASW